METMDEWMIRNQVSEREVARELGISQSTANRARNGFPVRLETALILHRATGGEVELESMIGSSAANRVRRLKDKLVRYIANREKR